MEYTARWGNKGFCVTPDKIVPFTGFMTDVALKKDNGVDTSGTAPTNTRGRELQTISFSTTYLRSAGVDPRAQLEEWEGEIGKSYPLYIGGERFGPEKMTLINVGATDLKLTPKGVFLAITVNITLEEYSEGGTSKLSGTGKSGDSTADNAAAAYDAAFKKAMGATPDTKEKKKILLPITGEG